MSRHDRGGRWAGRNPDKDLVRHDVWAALDASGAAVGPTWSHIPDFVGSELAAARLAGLPFWQAAGVVKCNPDPSQAPVRLRALQDGKRLYTPVPYLSDDLPYVRLDPDELTARGIALDEVADAEGFLRHGTLVRFEEMEPLDVCVVGCVAVTRAGGRTGKGGGFADLELGIFRELGWARPDTPVVTTVHGVQVVDAGRVTMVGHDNPLHWIVTPEEVIETRTTYPIPSGVAWEVVQPDQFDDIPFLAALRDELAG